MIFDHPYNEPIRHRSPPTSSRSVTVVVPTGGNAAASRAHPRPAACMPAGPAQRRRPAGPGRQAGRPRPRWSVHVQRQLIDTPVPGLSELDAQTPELEVGVQVPGDRRRAEVGEGHEEPDSFAVSADEVLSLIHISEPTRLGMNSYAVF